MDNAEGTYIGFIDSDDMISQRYVEVLLNKINEEIFDYCLFSWKYKQNDLGAVIITDQPPAWNQSIWNCIYKRDMIGNIRFNPDIDFGEDALFNYETRKGIKVNVTDILYIYNGGRIGGLT